jgi:hypothetical protein
VTSQPSLFIDPAAERSRIVAVIARRFACYGAGTCTSSRNPVSLTLAAQPTQFAFGVPVADVVAAVCDELGVLPVPNPLREDPCTD